MEAPEKPHDEEQRLQGLRSLNILDTPPEERFDRLTRMAKRLLRVPIALVSLVDENRQWFKSCQGLDVSETPRDVSFCGHTILSDEPLIINNALEDERFCDNPLVIDEPKIRFYAGYPLHVPGLGYMGTLCVIDYEPRELDQDDMEAFTDLAQTAQREIASVQLATLDELTGISNRRGFITLSKQGLSFCKRNDIPVSLVFLDLDKFKYINDTYGHAEGDKVLVNFAAQMRKTFRNSDLFARLGGDEFVILFMKQTEEQAELAIDRFQQSIDELNELVNEDYTVSFSHGIVEFNPEVHTSIKDMLDESDSLMYEQKKQIAKAS